MSTTAFSHRSRPASVHFAQRRTSRRSCSDYRPGSPAPTVIATRRRELDEPDTLEFLLDQPISTQGTTTFTFDDGQTTNVVSFHYAPDDEDADHDGVPNGEDLNPLDPHVCRDADGDLCDDCSIGVDGDGPLPDFDPANDGPDSDGDGVCDLSDNCIDDPNPSQADGDGARSKSRRQARSAAEGPARKSARRCASGCGGCRAALGLPCRPGTPGRIGNHRNETGVSLRWFACAGPRPIFDGGDVHRRRRGGDLRAH